ncbi:O-antigen ligase family protein [Micromonospora echinaurantiaca]|uniref:O-antigen ligase family protein n=1 Tax=Micromonospora echinaurantiaca TaxID=47857 RepID=UPI0037151D49
MHACAPSRPATAVRSDDAAAATADLRVRPRDIALVLPFVGMPVAILLDGSAVVADGLAPLLGSAAAGEHLLLNLDICAVVLVSMGVWVARGFRAPHGLWPFVLLLLSFSPALLLTSFGPYSASKVMQMMTMMPLLIFGSLLVFDRPARRMAVLWVLAFFGSLVAVLAIAFPDPLFETRDAVVLRGSATITTARAIGYAVVALLCLGVLVRRIRMAALVTAAVLAVPLVLTGSRGPVVALAAAAIALAALRSRGSRLRTALPVAGLGAVLAIALTSSFLPEAVASRFEVLYGGPLDQSSEARVLLSHLALDAVGAHPLGLGWGDFASVVPAGLLAVVPGREHVVYPHNLPLEVAVEGGLAAVAGLLLLTFALIRAVRANAADPSVAAATCLLVFAFVNSLFSSDINGNHLVWVLCAAVLAARPEPRTRPRHAVSSQAPTLVTASR